MRKPKTITITLPVDEPWEEVVFKGVTFKPCAVCYQLAPADSLIDSTCRHCDERAAK